MRITKPIIRANDSAFVRELKGTISWLIDRAKRNRILGDQSTTRVSRTAAGTVISALPQLTAGTAPVFVALTTKTNDTTYTGSVYADGPDQTATSTGVTIRVGDIASGETVPATPKLLAHWVDWNGTYYWTVDPARDY